MMLRAHTSVNMAKPISTMSKGLRRRSWKTSGILGASPHTQQGVLYDDLTLIFRGLQAVSNNGPYNIGGGGKPTVSRPALLCPVTQSAPPRLKIDDRSEHADITALELQVVGPGNSEENPAFGMEVMLNVSCASESECPPWVRIDRIDEIADRPAFFKRSWGLFAYSFGGAPDNRPVPIVASGWTDERNGKRVTQNTSNVTVYYDVGFLRTEFGLAVQDFGVWSRSGSDPTPLLFGPEVSVPDPSGGSSQAKTISPNASMLPSNLTPEQAATEMTKWRRAHEFSQKTGTLDIAYDGYFFRQNIMTLRSCNVRRFT